MAIHEELKPDDAALPYLMARANRLMSTDNSARTAGTIVVPNLDGTDTVLGTNGVAPWVGDTTPPGRPLDIEATSHLGTALVRWGGELEGGIPEDFLRVDVYARKTGESGEGTLVGSMRDAGELATGVFDVDSTIDVWAVALDNAHDANGFPAYNVSEESEHVSVEILPIVSQQEFDEAADNILAAAAEDVQHQIDRVDADIAATGEAIDQKAAETLEAANQAAQGYVTTLKEAVDADLAETGEKIDQKAAETLEAAKADTAKHVAANQAAQGYVTTLKEAVDADLAETGEKIDQKAAETLEAAKADTAKHVAQVNKDIEAANKLIAANTSAVETEAQLRAEGDKQAQQATQAVKAETDKLKGDYAGMATDVASVQQSIIQVASKADTALATANGKNRRYVQPTAPADTSVLVQGDEWWQTSSKPLETYWTGEPNNSPSVLIDHSNEVEHVWVWNGSRWNEQVLSAEYLLVPGSIAAGLVTANFFDGAVVKGGAFLTSNELIQLNNAGLVMTGKSGETLVSMNATDGTATFNDVSITNGTLTAPVLEGGTINGGSFNLKDASGKVIGQFNTNGISFGDKLTFSKQNNEWVLNLKGALKSGSTITGASVTGGTVQTVADENRGIKLTGGNLDIYRDDKSRFLRANENGLYISDENGKPGTVQTVADENRGIKLTGGNLDIYRDDKSRFLRANENGLYISDENGKPVLAFARTLRTYWEGEPNNSPSVLVDGWQLTLDGAIQSGGAISGTAITGGTMTGAIVQTDAAENRGVKLYSGTGTTGNIDVYRADGNVFFRVNEDGLSVKDGANDVLTFGKRDDAWKLSIKGDIQSGSTVSGATVVGASIYTNTQWDSGVDAEKYRGIVITSGGMSIKGDIQSGSTVSGATVVGASIYTNTQWDSGVDAEKYRGIVITSGGMLIYKGNGTDDTIFAFDVSQNKLIMDGAIQTNGEIRGAKLTGDIVNGGKVVGGTISTRSEDKRGITLNGNQLNAYNEQGQTILSLNGAGNGTALLTGGLKTAQSGRRIEVRNAVYGSYTEGTVKGYDTVGEAWHVVGTSDRTNGSDGDWYTQTLELGINPQQSEFRINYQHRWKTTTMHMLADRIDIVAADKSTYDSPYSKGVYVNGYRIDWEQDWHTLQLSSGISVVGAKCQYGIRCGLLTFIGRLRTPANGDNTLCDLLLCYEGFVSEPVNRTWIVGTMRNNVASTARCYIEANTTLLKVNGGPWDWVDIGSVVIAL